MSNVKLEEYEIDILDYYNCDVTSDYLVCAGFNGKSFPSEYVNSIKTHLHIIRRKDGSLKGNGKTLTKISLNDKSYPNLLPRNQFVVQNYEDNIISYIEPYSRKIKTVSLFSIEDAENAAFWKFLLWGSFAIISFLVLGVFAGRKLGLEKDWDSIRANLGLDPVGGITLVDNKEKDKRISKVNTAESGLTKGLTAGSDEDNGDGKKGDLEDNYQSQE